MFTQFLDCWVDSCVETITGGLGGQLCSHNLREVRSAVVFTQSFGVESAIVFTQFLGC